MIDILLNWFIIPALLLTFFFIGYIKLIKANEDDIHILLRPFAWCWFIVGALLDIAFNYIPASVLFLQLPPKGRITLSMRVKSILFLETSIEAYSTRWWIAYGFGWIAEQIDPGHVDMDKLSEVLKDE
jgi:hypothetical protein